MEVRLNGRVHVKHVVTLLDKQDTFRSQSGRFRSSSVRHLYLFQRLLLVIKKDDEGYQYKTHLEVSECQLFQ